METEEQRRKRANEGSSYSEQMANVGNFLATIPKTLVSAPGYGLSGLFDPSEQAKPVQAGATRVQADAYTDPRSLTYVGDTPATTAQQEAAREVAKTGPATGGVSTPENGATPAKPTYGMTGLTPQNVVARQIGQQPVENLNSSNDWQSRNDLRNLAVSANSIVGGRVSQQRAKQAAYAKALEADLAKRGGANPMAMEAMRGNAAAANANASNDLMAQRTNAGNEIQAARFGLDSLRAQQDANLTDARIREANAGIRAKDVQANAAEQIAALQKAYTTTTDEGKRKEIERQLQVLSGKYERAAPAEQYAAVAGGMDGKPIIYNKFTGQVANSAPMPSAKDVERLKKNPSEAALFDQVYGAGAAKQILGK